MPCILALKYVHDWKTTYMIDALYTGSYTVAVDDDYNSNDMQ